MECNECNSYYFFILAAAKFTQIHNLVIHSRNSGKVDIKISWDFRVFEAFYSEALI